MALLLERKGRFPEATELLWEVAAINLRTKGADGPSYANELRNLASTLIGLGDYAEAEAKLREALSIRRKNFGNDHPTWRTR